MFTRFRTFAGFWLASALLFAGIGCGVQPSSAPMPQDHVFDTVEQTLAALPDGFLNITPLELNAELTSSARPLLIDVRQPDEIARDGYIAGATSIPLRTLARSLGGIPADRAAPMVVYCGSGQRSPMAVFALRALDFGQVRNLQGGLGNWKRAGLPVATDDSIRRVQALPSAPNGVDGQVLGRLDEILTDLPGDFDLVQPAQVLQEIQSEEAAPILIDVRQPGETSHGMLEGATPIPIRTLLQDTSRLPDNKDANVVVYCGSGHRSAMALLALDLAGYRHVRSLFGGTGAWQTAGLDLGPGCGCSVPLAP
jgi:rhodanese-related sulfurtransferase